MSEKPQGRPVAPTLDLAQWIAGLRRDAIPDDVMRWASHCMLDWFGVTMAGANEDLVDLLVAEALADGGGPAPLIGRPETVSPSWAVLINGAASHALDYDDVNQALRGHATVAVLPAVLGEALSGGHTLDQMLAAFTVGYETACRVGAMTGDSHYGTGWHATATVGSFGAAAGVAWLRGLDAGRTAHALGQAATMASGLKAMFGTMAKPYHAGRAAQNGWQAARLSARGWIARDDTLEAVQGFWATQAPGADPGAAQAPWHIRNNLFKYHAACYMTHSATEACAALRARGVDPDAVRTLRLRVSAGHLKICNIAAPRTGLEVKFSLPHMAALALSGADTAAIGTYTDACAQDPVLSNLRGKVRVEPQETGSTMVTAVDVVAELSDGSTLVQPADTGIPATDLDAQERRLLAKFVALTGAGADGLADAVLGGLGTPADLVRLANGAP